jgi:phosphoribosylamine---glycine ligase
LPFRIRAIVVEQVRDDESIFTKQEQAEALLTWREAGPYRFRARDRKQTLGNEMKVLVIGGGGREHALVWKFGQSPEVEKIYCAPGNGGISQEAECVPLELSNPKDAADLAQNLAADLTVVGPELPLVGGIADEFARRGLRILGPVEAGARLEGSKIFSKQFLERSSIPTARTYGVFDTVEEATKMLGKVRWPVAIKADGLCQGKGVLLASSMSEAREFVERAVGRGEFGDAGKRVLIEEGLTGQELSYIVLTDGERFLPMAPSRDHKRALDGDLGPNTGGMGAYSAEEILPPALGEQIVETILKPTLAGLGRQGIRYCGFLYIGLMLTEEGPKVLEFNCRLGDPEAQAILLRANFDFARTCSETLDGRLGEREVKWWPAASAAIVVAADGYPVRPILGEEIQGIMEAEAIPGVTIFHAGTRIEGSSYYTSGGRVLAAAARGRSLEEACRIAYLGASKIRFKGAHFRWDIGKSTGRKSARTETANG